MFCFFFQHCSVNSCHSILLSLDKVLEYFQPPHLSPSFFFFTSIH
ncbi:hypothetical protein MXB_4947 [Myxobolus squamalis]|nr:hypothetical protein MXB_4947 [Myxobolus squamalis]